MANASINSNMKEILRIYNYVHINDGGVKRYNELTKYSTLHKRLKEALDNNTIQNELDLEVILTNQ